MWAFIHLFVVSIHALLAECDATAMSSTGVRLPGFNPRTPCGVRQIDDDNTVKIMRFQSTHSLRSATNVSALRLCRRNVVSIHALLAECDHDDVGRVGNRLSVVSIHALLAECDFHDESPASRSPKCVVSIHALLAECDLGPQCNLANHGQRFQSTHSLRSATAGDARPAKTRICSFNPRTPCGVRLYHAGPAIDGRVSGFNPRTPCGVRLRPTLYIATQQSKSYFAPTSLKRPSLHGCSF